jgi:hypothetical protein
VERREGREDEVVLCERGEINSTAEKLSLSDATIVEVHRKSFVGVRRSVLKLITLRFSN